MKPVQDRSAEKTVERERHCFRWKARRKFAAFLTPRNDLGQQIEGLFSDAGRQPWRFKRHGHPADFSVELLVHRLVSFDPVAHLAEEPLQEIDCGGRSICEALGQKVPVHGEAAGHDRIKKSALSVKTRVWVDSTGRIIRAKLAESTGDAAADSALVDEVLMGLQLTEPPPADMPSPIVLRLTARRSS